MPSVLKNSLYKNSGIEVRRSSKDDKWGIFARKNIKKYSLLEEVPFIKIPKSEICGISKYTYSYDDKFYMLGFGFSSLYNHSYDPNAKWMKDWVNMTIKHFAIKDILVDEEICVDYGEGNISFEVK
jgi:SET domain-containing protein